MDCHSVDSLIDAIKQGNRHVQLWQVRNVDGTDIKRIIDASYEHASTFKELGFFRCGLLEEHVQSLCEGLNPELTHLLIQYSNVKDEGVKHVAEMLQKPKSKLTRLFICDDAVSDYGVTLLAKALEKNQTLKLLCVSDNPLTIKGVNVLYDMLRMNTTLQILYLSEDAGSGINQQIIGKIQAVCRQPKLRADWQRIEILCRLSYRKISRGSPFSGLPIELCRLIKQMLCEQIPLE